jgi:hypothetical protein
VIFERADALLHGVETENFRASPARWTESSLSPDRLNTGVKPNRRTCSALARKRTFRADTTATAMRK